MKNKRIKLPKHCPKSYQGIGDARCWNCKLNREDQCPYNEFTKSILNRKEQSLGIVTKVHKNNTVTILLNDYGIEYMIKKLYSKPILKCATLGIKYIE
jgi:hypothetical protein